MKIKEIAFVCYAVKDIKKSRKFYEKVLGLKPTSVWVGKNMGFVEYSFGKNRAHTLAIGAGSNNFKIGKGGTTAALEVENFPKTIEELENKKVKFTLKPSDYPGCGMAIILDPDGNQIMIHKRKGK